MRRQASGQGIGIAPDTVHGPALIKQRRSDTHSEIATADNQQGFALHI